MKEPNIDPTNFAGYLNMAETIEKELRAKTSPGQSIKLAFLPSFNAKGIKEILRVKCFQLGVFADIYQCAYNQYAQELLDPQSGLYRFDPDVILLFIDKLTILGDLFYAPYEISEKEREVWVEERFGELQTLLAKAKSCSRAQILVHNFEVPSYSPYGILENKQGFGWMDSVRALNEKQQKAFAADKRIFLFDHDGFCSRIGKRNIMDERMYYLADMRLDSRHMPDLCDAYLGYLKPLLSLIRKCIILDLDNTLWGGLAGEEGLEGIQLGPTPEGRPFLDLQKHLLALFQRGVLLAVASRNNPEDALKVIRDHPHMVLKEKHFAALRINWDDKISNIKAIAEEMNIGLESMIFMDDDKANCEMVRKALPQVLVVDLPKDPALYARTLMEINDLNTLQLTEEDKNRGVAYTAQKHRADLRKGTDLSGYLKGLGMTAKIRVADPVSIGRIAQLTQRTNQFNMTAQRSLEADIALKVESGRSLVLSLSLKDKFEDMGIVGAAFIETGADAWRIDNLLMSCRAIGRKAEETLLVYILREALRKNVRKITAEFRPTAQNAPAKGFYRDNGFQLTGRTGQGELWSYDVRGEIPFPDCITVEPS